MSRYLTHEMVNDMHKLCLSYLESSLARSDGSSSSARNIDGSILIDKLVWGITLPFFLGIASSFAVDAIKNISNKTKKATDSKKQVEKLIGNEIDVNQLNSNEEILSIIKKNASKIGIAEDQVNDLLELMANNINSNKSEQ